MPFCLYLEGPSISKIHCSPTGNDANFVSYLVVLVSLNSISTSTCIMFQESIPARNIAGKGSERLLMK